MRRLIDATIGIKHAKFKIRVSNSMRLDLEMQLMPQYSSTQIVLVAQQVVSVYFFRINGLLVGGLSIGQIWAD